MESRLSVPGDGNRSSQSLNPNMVNPYSPLTDLHLSAPDDSRPNRRYLLLSAVSSLTGTIAFAIYGLSSDHRFMSQLSWLSGQLVSGLVVFFPVSLPLAIWLGILVARSRGPASSIDQYQLLWLTFPGVLPALCLLWGVTFRNQTRAINTGWQSDAITVMLFACFALGVLAVIMNRGQRWLAAAAACCIQWLCLGSAVLGGMSVTGDWI